MKKFRPATGTTEEWNAAYYRLEDYLRAHNLINKVHQSQIILRLLERAAVRHALDPRQPPLRLAMEEAHQVIDHWFARLLPQEPAARAAVLGRVSMLIINAPQRWPDVFLTEAHEVPPGFQAALRETVVQSGPDLRVSSMVPRPLDTGFEGERLDETWEKLGRMSIALVVGMACLFAGAVLFYLAN